MKDFKNHSVNQICRHLILFILKIKDVVIGYEILIEIDL
jgi:hypothetical protein